MVICGIKFTHDASVAVIEDGKLKFCVELEKLGNNRRYAEIDDVSQVQSILDMYGMRPDDVDSFVIDGWHGASAILKRGFVRSKRDGLHEIQLTVAPYHEWWFTEDVLTRNVFSGLPLHKATYEYASYRHVAAHILGTYCASPFARAGESAYVLVWDGGLYPRLYFVDPVRGAVINKGRLFRIMGTLYSIMGHYFGPYKRTKAQLIEEEREKSAEGYFGGNSIAGKLMSYIALGEVQDELLAELSDIHKREFTVGNAFEFCAFEHRFERAIVKHVAGRGYSDADVLRTQHFYLEQRLLNGLKKQISKDGLPPQNFCFAGGSALNIKWNSAIRRSGIFRSTWVAPFPNDSGNGLGAACCEMIVRGRLWSMDWNVYCGPAIRVGSPLPGWKQRPYNLNQLANLLAASHEPIVFLNSRAEVGPRALGNRSILAPATRPETKSLLNRIKKREMFRPIAPICLREHASAIFDPGTHDPYMLFDHDVREDWRSRIPAVCHLDGTARLQTVSMQDNEPIYRLIEAYRQLTGIPLLCNTSANLNGSGFFPDVESAMRWGMVNYIYCEDTLFEKAEHTCLV